MKILNSKNILSILVLIVGLLTGNVAFAQTETSSTGEDQSTLLLISLVIVVLLLVLVIAMYLLSILTSLVKQEGMKQAKAKGVEYIEPQSMLSQWYQGLTGAVPLENEESIILDHDYDGIRELDNHLPPWWTWLFYFSILNAGIYWFVYHTSGMLPLPAEEYEIEMAEAALAKTAMAASSPQLDESNVMFNDDPVALANGKKVYDMNCVACHKADGGGGIGPNLTDGYWLHGGSIQDIYNTISDGVPDKGMLAWKDLLSPSKMSDVTSYIETLKGTNPDGAKAPQGDKYDGASDTAPTSSKVTAKTSSIVIDETSIANGKKVFDMNCMACHGAEGGGGIGPNLTDDFWLHGGSNDDIYNIIKIGVIDKGMIPWEGILSDDKMKEVTAYIKSIKGTNPENAKAAEGDKYEGE